MCTPKLVYSERHKVNVDLQDGHCTSARRHDFGKIIPMHGDRYAHGRHGDRNTLYLHRIVCDACVPNPRPDLFDVVDHKDGNPANSLDPSNLRWVNQHLNNNNLRTLPGCTPPGVYVAKTRSQNGRWYSRIQFRKNGCILKSFRTLQQGVDFANKFNADYFRRLYDAYLRSPRDPFERRMYWAKHAMCVSDFRCDNRESRARVLAGKFLFSDKVFRKLTLKNNVKWRNGSTNWKRACDSC